jgi:arylsulfatase A-like enzyme
VLDAAHPRGVRTSTRGNASRRAETIVHCGKCAACSRPSDVRVLYDTRHAITTEMTRCAAKFAKPNFLGGDRDLDHLRACLVRANITFDNTVRFDDGRNGGDGPTCMDCWTDNIMCDSTQCNTNPSCIEKFFNPNNTGAFSGCLKCDEDHCGAEFIRCAGANRRSSGILSDISRPGQEVCAKGFYWNCSECHAACAKDNETCHMACDATKSCRGPQDRQGVAAAGRGAKDAVGKGTTTTTAAAAPNILILLVDDMGYSDTAAFGSPNASTPHIDALVASGMKFTQWISAASICTPSRASLQTGRYPIRTGCMGNVEQFRVIPTPASPGGLDPRTETSLAAALKQRGYARTGYSGKWHLGINSNKIGAPQDRRFTPIAHGYDTYVGAPWTNAPMCEMDSDTGTSTKYKSGPKYCFLTHNDTVVEMPLRVENFTRTVTDHAVEFIAERAAARAASAAAGQTAPLPPWFFMMSWFHVHTPLFTNRTNRGRSKGGRFGDNVEEMDDSVGAIVGALERYGFKNDTIIFFTSDNGPYQEEGWDRAGRTNIVEGGGGGRLKGGKGQLFEGGVRMPGAVVWPGHIKAGAVSDTMVSSMDIFPTVVELAEQGRGAVDRDDDLLLFGGGQVIDGKSMLPVLTGATNRSQHDVFLHYCGFQIISARVYGRWKVFWAIQKWYTNDPYNASICVQCCNGVNPLSVPVTGAPATELCGCQDKDLTWLDTPVVFDMRHDRREEHPLTGGGGWPADAGGVTYAQVIAAANATRKRMMADVPAKPNKAGAGVCTEGIPSGSRQPCCPGCSEFTLLSKGCTHKGIFGKECTCG